jgi:ABC-type branched-subunit amino acid transport system substrate-binding protein
VLLLLLLLMMTTLQCICLHCRPCFTQIISPDRFQTVVLANLVKGAGSPQPAGVLVEPNAYGQGLADGFTANYKKLGGTVKNTITITPTNAVAAAQELAKSGVKIVVMGTNNDTW